MDNDLAKRIKRLEEDILDYKTTQPVGSDSVRVYSTQSNNIWDVEVTATEMFAGDGYAQVRKAVRFKANKQQAPLGRLRAFVTINGNNYNYAGESLYFNDSTTPYVFMLEDTVTSSSEEMNDPTLLRWNFIASVPHNSVVRVKFFVDATDSGRLYWRDY